MVSPSLSPSLSHSLSHSPTDERLSFGDAGNAGRLRIGFIGAGRVALALSRALARAGERVTAVWSRSRTSAEVLSMAAPGCGCVASAQDVVDQADLVFVCVPDDAIAGVAASVAWRAGMAAIHCSGAADSDVLRPARSAGALTGGFHPLYMFADPEVAAAGLHRGAIAVEADPPLVRELERLVRVLGARVLQVPPGQRAAYHAGSHYAAAFVCVLLEQGEALFERIGFSRDDARHGLLALARGALDAIEKSGPGSAMAGAYSRGDVGTAKRHAAALQSLDPDSLPLFRTLAEASIALARQAGRIDAERAQQLEDALGAPPK